MNSWHICDICVWQNKNQPAVPGAVSLEQEVVLPHTSVDKEHLRQMSEWKPDE